MGRLGSVAYQEATEPFVQRLQRPSVEEGTHEEHAQPTTGGRTDARNDASMDDHREPNRRRDSGKEAGEVTRNDRHSSVDVAESGSDRP